MLEENKKDTRLSVWKTMIGVIIIVAGLYFWLGDDLSSEAWAVSIVLAVFIVLVNERRDTGVISEGSYWRYLNHLAFIFAVGFLLSPLWLDSWWGVLFGLWLGWIWGSNLRQRRGLKKRGSKQIRQ